MVARREHVGPLALFAAGYLAAIATPLMAAHSIKQPLESVWERISPGEHLGSVAAPQAGGVVSEDDRLG